MVTLLPHCHLAWEAKSRAFDYSLDELRAIRELVEKVAFRLNELISRLIEADEQIDPREFDLWRGMTAG